MNLISTPIAKTGIIPIDLTQIPYPFLHALGQVIASGTPRYGYLNWLSGANDPSFRRERQKHAARHWALAMHLLTFGPNSLRGLADAGLITHEEAEEDHLAKVVWYCMTEIHFRVPPAGAGEANPIQPPFIYTPLLDQIYSDVNKIKDEMDKAVGIPPRVCSVCKLPAEHLAPLCPPDSREAIAHPKHATDLFCEACAIIAFNH